MSVAKLRIHLQWITENSWFPGSEKGHIERLRASTRHTIQVLNSPNDIRHNKRLSRFTLRSKTKVAIQWNLYCLVHNIEKLAHHGYR